MTSEEPSPELMNKLDTIIRLVAMNVIQGRQLKDQIRILDQAGLSPKEIANILGKSSNVVRVTLFNVRKAKGDGTSS